ncbi:hypothetical protein Taro_011704 [Colocasia esculenta]|uniref:ABC-2 type transporter transmembrane domain-containing protein n=1 Tax=Colocasia esculenta TaxID=4460 RepID=A0A843U710_COLES|nr:hypothetical protein [Colocasia esculenta]
MAITFISPDMPFSSVDLLQLQQLVDSFIILAVQNNRASNSAELRKTHTHNQSGVSTNNEPFWSKFSPENIRVAPFPTRAYTDDEFQSIIKNVMGVLYLLGFLYPVSRLLSYYVFEKEHKIKEGLYMMGLKDKIFYLSWFITYALQYISLISHIYQLNSFERYIGNIIKNFAASSVIITICTMTTLFKYSDKSLVFIYFFLFGLSAVMLSFLISTFFSRAKTAVAVGSLSFLGAFFPYYTVNDAAVSSSVPINACHSPPWFFCLLNFVHCILASLLSPTAFALGTVNFADYERAHVGLRWSNMWQDSSGVNFLVCLMMMMLDTVLYCALGLYFDKVLPRDNGVRHPWNFLFTKLFHRSKNMPQCSSGVSEQICEEVLASKMQCSGNGSLKPAIEPMSLDMKQQEVEGRCIQVKSLHKNFTTRQGKCCAVNSLQLTLFENQILALLGTVCYFYLCC